MFPLFEDVITSFRAGRPLESWTGAESDHEFAFDLPGPAAEGLDEGQDECWDKCEKWDRTKRVLVAPVVGSFVPARNRTNLKGMNLQLITKIASVELTTKNHSTKEELGTSRAPLARTLLRRQSTTSTLSTSRTQSLISGRPSTTLNSSPNSVKISISISVC